MLCKFLVLFAIILGPIYGTTKTQTKHLIFSFEAPKDLQYFDGAPREIVRKHSTEGKMALKIELSEEHPFFIVSFQEKNLDCKGWEKLKLDIYREGEPITLNLRIFDNNGNRYNFWYYLLHPGLNIVEYSILGMSSTLDISHLKEFTFYSEQPSGSLYVDNIRLIRGEEDDTWLIPKDKPKPMLSARNNIIKNGDFELGFLYWGSWGQWDGGMYIFGSGKGEDACSGEVSAAIICQKKGRGGIYTSPSAYFYLQPGTYKLSFYAKGKGDGVKMLWFFHKMEGGGPSVEEAIPKNNRSDRFDVPFQWNKYEYEIQVVKEVGPLAIYLCNVGGGTLYVDALSLVREGEKATESKVFSKRRPSKVEIRKGEIYVNSKPFFPIGFYNAEPEDLKGTGFNLICRDPGPGIPGRDFLDRCEENGIMVSVNLEGVLRAHLPWKVPEVIKSFMDHPAVFAWYTCDEPDHAQWTVPPPEMRLATKLLHKADPNHLTWTVVMPWADSNIYQYADTVDIIATDVYPISGYNREVIRVALGTDVLKRAVRGERPVFMVTEATAQATPEEEYAMTYLAITHGAKGIIYWNYKDAKQNPIIWDTMLKIGKELKELTPILTSPDSPLLVNVNNPNIHFLLKKYKGKFYLLTINASKESQGKVVFHLPFLKESKNVKVLFEGRELRIKEGVLEDSYAGYERHIYEIDV